MKGGADHLGNLSYVLLLTPQPRCPRGSFVQYKSEEHHSLQRKLCLRDASVYSHLVCLPSQPQAQVDSGEDEAEAGEQAVGHGGLLQQGRGGGGQAGTEVSTGYCQGTTQGFSLVFLHLASDQQGSMGLPACCQ